jgi:hypothetical protein
MIDRSSQRHHCPIVSGVAHAARPQPAGLSQNHTETLGR